MYFTIAYLRLPRQCEFSNIDERLIDAIIFGTNCSKAEASFYRPQKHYLFNTVFLYVETMRV